MSSSEDPFGVSFFLSFLFFLAKKKRKEKRRQKYLTSKIPVVLSKNTNHKNLGTLSDVCFSWADVNVSRFCNDLYSRRQELLYFWGYNQPLQILFDEFLFLCYSSLGTHQKSVMVEYPKNGFRSLEDVF